jgi:predicted PurR-regulated permease PerM
MTGANDVQPLREETETMQALRNARGQIGGSGGDESESEERNGLAARLHQPLTRPLWILALCALILGLRASREALIPLILAILLSLMLSGLVEGLRRLRIPRGVSATLLLLLGGVTLAGTLDALWAPAQEWVQSAPRVMREVERKVRPARAVVQRMNDLAARAAAITGSEVENNRAANSVAAPLTAMEVLTETGWVAGGVVTVGVLTLLLLSAGPPTLARMMSAVSGNLQAVHVLKTIDAVRVEVGRYYGTLALINLSLGIATALIMWLLRMPNPVLWGAMAAVLNFVPYLGSAVTLLVLSGVALVSFDSIPHALLVPASYLGLATIEGQIVEPVFFGRRLAINPIVIFITLWFGGWLWGIAGVMFALPVLVAVKVAAAQGGGGMVLRFLGPASSTVEEAEALRSRLHVPTVLGGGLKAR